MSRATPDNDEISLILRTASTEFARHGYEALSMRQLAQRCGVTTGAIYHYFSSKEALFEESCRKKFDDIAYLIDKNARAGRSPSEKLEIFINTLFDEWQRDSTLLLLTQRDVVNILSNPEHSLAGPHYRKLMDIARAHLGEFLGKEQESQFYFTFGALLYGYCTLMNHDIQYSTLPLAEYMTKRREALHQHALLLLDAVNESSKRTKIYARADQ